MLCCRQFTLPEVATVTNSGAITNVIVDSNFITTCRLGPLVSLNGSPTVSPLQQLCAHRYPYHQIFVFVSINFLALSHAPPAFLFRNNEQQNILHVANIICWKVQIALAPNSGSFPRRIPCKKRKRLQRRRLQNYDGRAPFFLDLPSQQWLFGELQRPSGCTSPLSMPGCSPNMLSNFDNNFRSRIPYRTKRHACKKED